MPCYSLLDGAFPHTGNKDDKYQCYSSAWLHTGENIQKSEVGASVLNMTHILSFEYNIFIKYYHIESNLWG